jgi:hypothetical protein
MACSSAPLGCPEVLHCLPVVQVRILCCPREYAVELRRDKLSHLLCEIRHELVEISVLLQFSVQYRRFVLQRDVHQGGVRACAGRGTGPCVTFSALRGLGTSPGSELLAPAAEKEARGLGIHKAAEGTQQAQRSPAFAVAPHPRWALKAIVPAAYRASLLAAGRTPDLFLPLLLQGLQQMLGTVHLAFILADCLDRALGPTTDLGQIPAEQSSELGFVSGVGGTSE